jgi:hypothetical protein
MPDQLFLCFFGDGPFWRDFVLAPAYPSGFSYIWPFRYDDKWVQPKLQTELATPAGRKKLENTEATLGVRFGNPHSETVLPLRKITLTHVDTSAGLYSFYFRAGPLVDVQSATELSTVGIPISASEKAVVGSSLAFRSASSMPAVISTDPDLEDRVWAKLCELICSESVLPINPQAKQSLFLRFGIPSAGLHPVAVECLYTSEGQGPVYGASFREGQVYEVTYSHRIPWLGGKNTTVSEIPVDYKLPTSSVELNSPTGSVIGNYQVTHISVAALRSSATWEELVIAPRERDLTSQNGDKINAFDVKIPFTVKLSILHRFRTTWVYVLLLWLALTMLGVITSIAQLVKDVADGKPIDFGLYKYYVPLTALASAIVAVVIFLLQEKLKDKVKSH